MLFFTHLVAAALLARPTRLSPVGLVAGAALPDLIDKPLGTLGVFDIYHTVGHSLLFLAIVGPLALFGRQGVAVLLGWLSHLLLDAVHVVLNGRPEHLTFLGWPLLQPNPLEVPPGEFVFYYLWSPSFFLELGIWCVVGYLLVANRHTVRRILHERI